MAGESLRRGALHLSCYPLILFHLPAGTQKGAILTKICFVMFQKVLSARHGADFVEGHLIYTGGSFRLAAVFIVAVDTIAALRFDG